MKFSFNPAPNYHSGSSTRRIMAELTVALLVVFAFAVYYQATTYGMGNVIHIVLMLVAAVASAILVEMIWAVLVVKKNPVQYIKNSFPWVTAIILVLMLPANMGIYPVVIGTIFAIVVAKLLFGGFGQNVFNPAAAGCAIVFSYFATNVAADVVTAATPTASIAATHGWVITDAAVWDSFLKSFGGLSGMFLGLYDGALGETCTLLLLLIGVYLAVRKIIDWRVPVFYLGTVFVLTTIYGLCMGASMMYPLFHLLTGGVVFGSIFMATDPVTNPTSNTGRILFAIGCGILTVLIRLKGSLPEGVLYSILLMNMLTPWIERLCAGVQFKMVKKSVCMATVLALIGAAMMPLLANIKKEEIANAPKPEEPKPQEFLNADQHLLLNGDYSGYPAKVTDTKKDGGNTVYTVEVEGYAFGHYDDPQRNVIEVVLNRKDKTIVSVKFVTFRDTEYVGDKCKDDRFLSQFAGLSYEAEDSGVDAVTGATITSQSVTSSVQAAIQKANKK